MPQICIFCSEAASLIGYTERFRSRANTIVDVMMRNNLQPAEQEARKEYLAKVQDVVVTVDQQIPTAEQIKDAVKTADPTDEKALKEMVHTLGGALMSAITTKEEVRDAIASIHSVDTEKLFQQTVANAAERTKKVAASTELTPKEVRDIVQSKRNTDSGTVHEDADRARHEEEQQCKVTRVQDGYTMKLKTPEEVPYVVYGRLDGYDETTQCVVEYKHRAYRLFGMVPRYENVQLHLYMAMTGAKHGQLVETYNNMSNIHEVPFDTAFFEEIKQGLDKAVTEMVSAV